MARPKRKRPHDPAAAERHRAEREANRAEVARLQAQPSTAVNTCPRTGRLTGAKRLNCFNSLLIEGSREHQAVDWLEETVRTAEGANTPERNPEFIRASNDGAPGQNVTGAMIQAGLTLAVIKAALPPAHSDMMLALMKPDADLLTRWRGVVERYTGEKNPQAQGAAVRSACTHLAWIRDNIGLLERTWKEVRKAA